MKTLKVFCEENEVKYSRVYTLWMQNPCFWDKLKFGKSWIISEKQEELLKKLLKGETV